MGNEDTDIADLVDKAKIVAEATGRDEQDVLADLLDDGIVNMSNESNGKDLVTQLKEAAELITTVQAINKDVAENTVLNGGDNKTVVEIETTLEGDIVDRAIESIQRKSENIKRLLITMTPLFLLLTGGGLEAIGIIDVMGDDAESSLDDEYYNDIWGCTAYDAANFMSEATVDDGTCYWEDNNGGGGGPPQNCDWSWNDNSYTNDAQPTTLFMRGSFSSPQCPNEMEGDFRVIINKENQFYDEEKYFAVKFYENQDVEHEFIDVDEGYYTVSFSFETYDGSIWNWDSSRTFHFEDPVGCDAYFINEQAYLLEEDTEKDAVRISADVALVEEENNCDDEQFEIIWQLYQENDVKYEHTIWEDGTITDPDGADYISHTWDGVQQGTYDPKAILILNGEILDEKWISHTISIEEEAVYGCMNIEATNYNSNANNTTNCYVEGWVSDTKFLILDNFTNSNMTHYDFYFYVFWTDGNGDNQIIEREWLNHELTP